DFTLVRQMPLTEAWCDDRNAAHLAALAVIPTLEKINGKPKAQVLGATKPPDPTFEQWVKETQQLPPEKQVEAVATKLKELNPGFDGKVEHKVENGTVTKLKLVSDQVTDLTPVRALSGLRDLTCNGASVNNTGKLKDLAPLRGMQLQVLAVDQHNQLQDLSPLAGMPLTKLFICGSAVRDLNPLRGMALVH